MDELFDVIVKNLQQLILHPETTEEEAKDLSTYVEDLTALWSDSMDRRAEVLAQLNTPEPQGLATKLLPWSIKDPANA